MGCSGDDIHNVIAHMASSLMRNAIEGINERPVLDQSQRDEPKKEGSLISSPNQFRLNYPSHTLKNKERDKLTYTTLGTTARDLNLPHMLEVMMSAVMAGIEGPTTALLSILILYAFTTRKGGKIAMLEEKKMAEEACYGI